MKLTIEGNVEEIENFLLDLLVMPADSVPQPAPADDTRKDRKEEEKKFCPPGEEELSPIQPGEKDRKPEDKVKLIYIHRLAASTDIKPHSSVPPEGPASDPQEDIITEFPKLPTKDDLLIPRFSWDKKDERTYKRLIFAELPDGKVMLNYIGGRVFSTKEKILRIPYPVPNAYLIRMGITNNHSTAIRLYREYLDSVRVPNPGQCSQGDRKGEDDPDEVFKPMLKGAFSTRPGKEDRVIRRISIHGQAARPGGEIVVGLTNFNKLSHICLSQICDNLSINVNLLTNFDNLLITVNNNY